MSPKIFEKWTFSVHNLVISQIVRSVPFDCKNSGDLLPTQHEYGLAKCTKEFRIKLNFDGIVISQSNYSTNIDPIEKLISVREILRSCTTF